MKECKPLPPGPVYKPGRPPLPIMDGGVKAGGPGLTAGFESIVHVCVIPTYKVGRRRLKPVLRARNRTSFAVSL